MTKIKNTEQKFPQHFSIRKKAVRNKKSRVVDFFARLTTRPQNNETQAVLRSPRLGCMHKSNGGQPPRSAPIGPPLDAGDLPTPKPQVQQQESEPTATALFILGQGQRVGPTPQKRGCRTSRRRRRVGRSGEGAARALAARRRNTAALKTAAAAAPSSRARAPMRPCGSRAAASPSATRR